MPNPNLNRPHLLKGNPGLSNPAGYPRDQRDREAKIRKVTQRMLLSPLHRATLQAKLDDCTLHPSMMVLLYYYAWGKPREVLEQTAPSPVRIVHEYRHAPDLLDPPEAADGA